MTLICNEVHLFYVLSSFAINSLRKRAGCFTLCSCCRVAASVLCLPRGGVGWSVIVAFPGHTGLLFSHELVHLLMLNGGFQYARKIVLLSMAYNQAFKVQHCSFIWASTQQNLSSGFPIKSPQLQRLAMQ